MGDYEHIHEENVVEIEKKEEEKLKPPPKYAVVFHNDDYTTMDFVTEMLMKHFKLSLEDAVMVMLDVHQKGQAIAGVYTQDIAITKIAIVLGEARSQEFPLLLTAEKYE